MNPLRNLLLTTALTSTAMASVYRDDVPPQAFIDLGNNAGGFAPGVNYPDFSSTATVVNANGQNFGSGVLIGDRWLLSAAHVFVDEENPFPDLTNAAVSFGSTYQSPTDVYAIEQVIIPDRYTEILQNPGSGDVDDYGLDIALVKLAEPASGAYPRMTWASNPALDTEGARLYLSGYGQAGNGNEGSILPAGTKRAVSNTIDRVLPMGLDRGNGMPIIEGGLLAFDFDSPLENHNTLQIAPGTISQPAIEFTPGDSNAEPTDFEGTSGPGDSGGPLFLYIDHEWIVAGIASYGITEDETYGDIAAYTQVSQFNSWIASNIPEPRHFAMALGAVLMCVVGLRRRTIR